MEYHTGCYQNGGLQEECNVLCLECEHTHGEHKFKTSSEDDDYVYLPGTNLLDPDGDCTQCSCQEFQGPTLTGIDKMGRNELIAELLELRTALEALRARHSELLFKKGVRP